MTPKNQHTEPAPRTGEFKSMSVATLWVFVIWLIIGHGFWLGWQYGIRALSPVTMGVIPYSPKIFISAALIAILSSLIGVALKFLRFSMNHFTLVNVFNPTSTPAASSPQKGAKHV
jgi:hypothetical protein